MIRIIVSGCCGRMGRHILHLAISDEATKLVGAIELASSKDVGKDVGDFLGIGNVGVNITNNLKDIIKKTDVLIEFTTPAATIEHLDIASANGKAMVIGTTGLSEQEVVKIKSASKRIPILFSPNMSLGVNLLFKIVQDIARTLPLDYDVEIIEAHHGQKKDAPSGTALNIGQIIAKARGKELNSIASYGRKGTVGARPKDQIGIHSIRAADIVGEHTVLFAAPGESIELIHRARSRETFARGAIIATKFIAKKTNGLYTMQDVLKIG